LDYIAIDIGSRKSQLCIRDAAGQILREIRTETRELVALLSGHAPASIVMETCSEAFALAVHAKSFGHQVTVVPATEVRRLGVGARGVKTDMRDARALSEAAWRGNLPCVHVPSIRARQWRRMLSARELLVTARTRAINATRGYLRTQLLQYRQRGPARSFAPGVRDLFSTEGHEPPACIVRQLALIEILSDQLREADAECSAIAKADALCCRLMTVPGVGPLTALNFVAAIDDVTRFRDAHGVQSYLGLTPGELSSGTHVRRTSITKAGSPRTRKCLMQAAWSVYRMAPDTSLGRTMARLVATRGKKVAATAIARRLAGILFALWRDGRDYSPWHSVRQLDEPTAAAM